MTALPARCRNTNDALRKPVAWRPAGCAGTVPTAPGSAPWRGLRALGALGGCRGAARRPCAGHAGAHRRAGHGCGCSVPSGAADASAAAGGTAGGSGAAAAAPAGPGVGAGRDRQRRLRIGPGPGATRGAACGTAPGTAPGTRRRHRRNGQAGGQREPDRHLARFDNARRGRRRRGRFGQRRVQRRRRNPFGGLRGADDDPVARRILHQVRGVAGRDHAQVAGRLGERGRGLGLEHVALEGLLLLQQRLVDLAGVAQLVGPLGGVGGQPQRDAEAEPERRDDQHDERHPGDQACAGSDRSRRGVTRIRSRSGTRTTLGALAFRALARALAWLALFGRAGTSLGGRPGWCAAPTAAAAVARRPAAAAAARRPGAPARARAPAGALARRRARPLPAVRPARPRGRAARRCCRGLARRLLRLHRCSSPHSLHRPQPDRCASRIAFDLVGVGAFGATGQRDELRSVPGQFDRQPGRRARWRSPRRSRS